MTARSAIRSHWKRLSLLGVTRLLYCRQDWKVISEPPKRTISWLPKSAENIPKRRKNCTKEQTDTTEGVALAQVYTKRGKVLIVAPDDTCGASTLSHNPKDIKHLYEKGYADGQKVKNFMQI